jgi:hypothetical protein
MPAHNGQSRSAALRRARRIFVERNRPVGDPSNDMLGYRRAIHVAKWALIRPCGASKVGADHLTQPAVGLAIDLTSILFASGQLLDSWSVCGGSVPTEHAERRPTDAPAVRVAHDSDRRILQNHVGHRTDRRRTDHRAGSVPAATGVRRRTLRQRSVADRLLRAPAAPAPAAPSPVHTPDMTKQPLTAIYAGQGLFGLVVAGEGFEPSKLSRRIYRPLGPMCLPAAIP